MKSHRGNTYLIRVLKLRVRDMADYMELGLGNKG